MSSRRPHSLFENSFLPSPGSLKISSISVEELANSLTNSNDLLLIDFRKYERYAISHVLGAESLEKLSVHQSNLTNSLCSSNARSVLGELVSHLGDFNKKCILYDEDSYALRDCPVFILPLVEHLINTQNDVYLLRGGYSAFTSQYPQLCVPEDDYCVRLSTSKDLHDSNSLPVQSPSQTSSNSSRKLLNGCFSEKNPTMARAASMVVITPDHTGPDFCSFLPSAILPHVYIGSEFDAKDLQFLTSQKITHVLNVTTHIPCYYENRLHIFYKRLPACDTDNDNIKQYFDEASDFIESAEHDGGKVLVHCQAGISRSPSIVLAYLISRKNMAFSDAYQLIAKLRPIIAPNFNFLAQLNEFELEVASSRRSSSEISTGSSSDFDDQDPCNNSCGSNKAQPPPLLLVQFPPTKRCRMMAKVGEDNNNCSNVNQPSYQTTATTAAAAAKSFFL